VVTPQVSAIVGAGINFETNFLSTSNQYLRLTLSFGAQASAWYSIAQFSIGPSNRTQGPAFSDPVQVTFTGTWVTNTTYTAFETRIGSLARYDIKIALIGAPTAATLVLTLPSGRTIDTTKLANTGATAGNILPNSSVGITDISTESYAGGVHYSSSTSVGILWTDDNAVATKFFGVTATAPMTFASGDTISISFIVPIAEWASSALNLGPGAQVEYAYNNSATTSNDTSSFAYGPSGFAIQNFAPSGTTPVTKRVQFQYPIQVTDQIILEVQDPTTGVWIGFADRFGAFSTNDANTTFQGQALAQVASNQVNVAFYSATVGGGSWASINTWKWRVKKVNPSSPVGFGLANVDGSAGLYKAGSAPGSVTGAAIASGYIGQVLTYSLARATPFALTTAVSHNIAAANGTPAITLTPGFWSISFAGGFSGGATTQVQNLDVGLSLTNAATGSPTGINMTNSTTGEYRIYRGYPASFAPMVNGDLELSATYYCNTSSTIPLYFVANAIFTTSTLSVYGSVTAVRIA
jgi:hypothetical protein